MAVVDTDVIPIGTVVVVPQYLTKSSSVPRTEIILEDDIVAVEVDVPTGRISRAVCIGEPVFFNEYGGCTPCPNATAPTPFPGIVIAAGMINVISGDMNHPDIRHLHTRPSGM